MHAYIICIYTGMNMYICISVCVYRDIYTHTYIFIYTYINSLPSARFLGFEESLVQKLWDCTNTRVELNNSGLNPYLIAHLLLNYSFIGRTYTAPNIFKISRHINIQITAEGYLLKLKDFYCTQKFWVAGYTCFWESHKTRLPWETWLLYSFHMLWEVQFFMWYSFAGKW